MRAEPILINDQGQPTVHYFTRTEPVEVLVYHELCDGTQRITRAVGTASIYTCSKTGAERRWGIS